jgi:putative PIN family toxin of toxin-antitoxin system
VPPGTPFIVVLDTNVLVRLVLSRTEQSRAVFETWRVGRFRVAASQAILSELRRVLHYPRIQQAFHLSDNDIADAWEEIRRRVFLVEGLYEVFAVERNTSDNIFLACALEVGADYLVSQDPHLRDLKYYHGTQIISWTQLLDLLGS